MTGCLATEETETEATAEAVTGTEIEMAAGALEAAAEEEEEGLETAAVAAGLVEAVDTVGEALEEEVAASRESSQVVR